jgi:hypothetical protein
MKSVGDPRLGTDLPELGPMDEFLLGLVEAGCQYLRDHPEARSEMRRSGGASLRRMLLKQLDDDEDES